MPSFKNIYCEDTGETAKTYNDYLQTKHWKSLREKVIQQYGGECQRCHDIVGESGNVHHKTYKRIGHERISDLTLYCSKCHGVTHNRRAADHNLCAQINIIVQQMDNKDREKVLEYAQKISDISGAEIGKREKAKSLPTKYYAIRQGKKSNVIVNTWREAKKLIEHVSGAQYQKFSNAEDAQVYLSAK